MHKTQPQTPLKKIQNKFRKPSHRRCLTVYRHLNWVAQMRGFNQGAGEL